MTMMLYEAQRAMRQRRAVAMKRGLVAVLDIGTSKIACLVLKFDPERAESFRGDGVGSLAGQGEFRVIGAATTRARGMEFGEIIAMEEAERAVRTAVQGAQKMANVRVDHVIACFSGAQPRSYGLAGAIDLHDTVVTDQDVGRVLASCDVPDVGEGREVLHAHIRHITTGQHPAHILIGDNRIMQINRARQSIRPWLRARKAGDQVIDPDIRHFLRGLHSGADGAFGFAHRINFTKPHPA